jgi:hypothetical protein
MEGCIMPKKPKPDVPKKEPTQAPADAGRGFPLPPGGTLVFQHPAAKDFGAWQGPTVRELVEDKAQQVMATEAERYKAITIRPTVQDVELLDELAKLFRQSRNEAACSLLGAALREALHSLPDHIRERVQLEAFKRLEWGVITPAGQVILPDSMFKDGKLVMPGGGGSGPEGKADESDSKGGAAPEE